MRTRGASVTNNSCLFVLLPRSHQCGLGVQCSCRLSEPGPRTVDKNWRQSGSFVCSARSSTLVGSVGVVCTYDRAYCRKSSFIRVELRINDMAFFPVTSAMLALSAGSKFSSGNASFKLIVSRWSIGSQKNASTAWCLIPARGMKSNLNCDASPRFNLRRTAS